MDNRDSIDFESENIAKLFSSIFFPTLLGMVFSIAFILTDGIFIGRGVGSDGLACVNLVGPLMMLFSGTGMMFAIGASVVGAIHLAKNNTKAARINITQAFLVSGCIAIGASAIMYLASNQILRLLGTTEHLLPMCRQYYLWFIPTCLFTIIETIGLFVIRLDGSPRFAMMANIIPALVNAALDYVFIFGCRWGLMGAALATDIGGLIGAAIVGWYMLRRVKVLHLYRLKANLLSLRLTLRNTGYMLRVGFSGFVGEFAVSTMMIAGNYMFLKYLGEDGVAAFSVICYLFPIVFIVNNSVAQSAQPIISYNFGANRPDRVRRAFVVSLGTAAVCGLSAMLLLGLFGEHIVTAFLQRGTQAHSYATHGVKLFSASFMILALNISCIGYFQSIERMRVANLIMILRGVVLVAVCFVTLPPIIGTNGLWLAVPLAELITLVLTVALVAWLWRKSVRSKRK